MSLRRLLDRTGRRAADAALARAFPDLDRAERARLARESSRLQTRITRDARRVETISPRAFCRRLQHRGWRHLHAVARSDRGLVMLGAPAGCWDVARRALELYRPRLEATIPAAPAAGAAPDGGPDEDALVATLAGGGDVAIAVHPVADETGPWRLLGARARASDRAARLALAAGAPIVPVFALPEADGAYRLTFRDAIVASDGGGGDALAELMTRCLAAIEDVVREQPAVWPWRVWSGAGRAG